MHKKYLNKLKVTVRQCSEFLWSVEFSRPGHRVGCLPSPRNKLNFSDICLTFFHFLHEPNKNTYFQHRPAWTKQEPLSYMIFTKICSIRERRALSTLFGKKPSSPQLAGILMSETPGHCIPKIMPFSKHGTLTWTQHTGFPVMGRLWGEGSGALHLTHFHQTPWPTLLQGSPGGLWDQNLVCNAEDLGSNPGTGRSLENKHTYSIILPGKPMDRRTSELRNNGRTWSSYWYNIYLF